MKGSWPGLTAAFAGVATVRVAGAVGDADCCIVVDASVAIGLDDVAGLDDDHWSRGRARDRCIAAMMRESVQVGVCVEADAVLLREAKHQRRAGEAVLAQARGRRCE